VWLTGVGADYTVDDKSVKDLTHITSEADIIISGTGLSSIIKEDMVKKGVVLIDIGTSSENGEIKGDIDPAAYKKASYVAPVPGGVGPVAIAMLIENLFKLYRDKL
jgi:methylenetetrahydrofolate dehydrogenase (NADP+)/methenyltetrahydrofolate cyclohydrolase